MNDFSNISNRSDEQNHLVVASVKLPNDERCFRADRYDDERNGWKSFSNFMRFSFSGK